ncbi:MAG: hypothetical protein ACSHXF_08435 [Aquaticitalea sp.]
MTEIINQIFALEQKSKKENISLFDRQLERIYHEFETSGYHIINPLGQPYKNEMTDVEANIVGEIHRNMKIVKVLKPTIYQIKNDQTELIQKGIVIVE